MGDTSSLLLTLCSLFMVALCMEISNLKMSVFLKPKRNFTEARQICRQHHVDLVTLDMAKQLKMTGTWTNKIRRIWIGEHRDQRNSSVLRTIDPEDGAEMWTHDNPDDEDCPFIRQKKLLLNVTACSRKLPFFCFTDNLVLVKENKTWEDAQQHCEDLETQCEVIDRESCKHSLLTFPGWSDNVFVRERISGAETDEVWTGLRFLAGYWFWTDGQELKNEGVLPDCPSEQERCGTLSKNDTNNWITRDCSDRRNFICAKTPRSHSNPKISEDKRHDSSEDYK